MISSLRRLKGKVELYVVVRGRRVTPGAHHPSAGSGALRTTWLALFYSGFVPQEVTKGQAGLTLPSSRQPEM